MPFLNVKIIEGVFDDSQKREMIEKLTDTMVEIEGETMRGVTWVVLEEVKSGDWGIGGQSLTTEDVHALAAGAPACSHVADRGRRPPRFQGPLSPGVRLRRLGGVRIGYEVFGQGEETLLFLPPWSIVHSRFWKAQVPYLARHFRVITFDPRGSGRSDRPDTPAGYGPHKDALDAIAVLDATGTSRCVFVAHCAIAGGALLLATDHPERVVGAVFMTPALPISPPRPERTGNDFEAVLPHYEGWAKSNRHYWQRTSAAISSSSSAAACRSRTRPSRSRTRSAGPWRARRTRSRSRSRRRTWTNRPHAS